MRGCWCFGIILICAIIVLGSFTGERDKNLVRAEYTLEKILTLYSTGNNLYKETYPDKAGNPPAAYLWPTSAVFSGVNELLRATGKKKYRVLLEKQTIPGLDQYYDNVRIPAGYQSGIVKAGQSDRYYDDDVWLAIDYCESYRLTRKRDYLERSVNTWKFIISGWDDKLAGGIYWCEQKKESKNTCSNAPASVLAFRLFGATGDSSYFKWGERIYNWTKRNLRDTIDHLYFDNIDITGKVDRRKYTYNSGQMLQASAILYSLTGDRSYLDEANHIAKSVIDHFTEEYHYEGRNIRLFRNTGNWFNYILLRGYIELYTIDNDPAYLNIFRDNMDQVWNHARNKDGLFIKDWKGGKENQFKELLDQAGLMAIFAALAGQFKP